MAQIILTPEEAEKLFLNSLCNASYFLDYGSIESKKATYTIAKKSLEAKKATSRCYEDVLMEVLRVGGKLQFECREGEEYNREITLKDVHERVQLAPMGHVVDALNEEDDAITASVILQQVFLNEQPFG